MQRDAKVYVAGHKGLVGSAIVRCLTARGYTNVITRSRRQLDLTRQHEVEAFLEIVKPDYVFLVAAKVGGIWANKTYPAEFIHSNMTIQSNVIHGAWQCGVKRLIFLGSSCIYPRECRQPIKEDYLLTGALEPTNEPYALAKIAGMSQCESYNRQYGTSFLAVMPTNLYGPNDNFDLETSHVLSALIRKFHLAKLARVGDVQAIEQDEMECGPIPQDFKKSLSALVTANGPFQSASRVSPLAFPAVKLWGTGSPRREFLHVDDLADACIHLINLDDSTFAEVLRKNPRPMINIGYGDDLTIRELAELVAKVVGYEGKVEWDGSKPDGTPRKLLDVSRLRDLGWKPHIALARGIDETYAWYKRREMSSRQEDARQEEATTHKTMNFSPSSHATKP